MSVPAPPYGSLAPLPSPARPMYRVGIAHTVLGLIVLGLLVTVGLMLGAAWLAVAGVTIGGDRPVAVAPEVQAAPVQTAPWQTTPWQRVQAPTPSGTTVAFDQVWTAGNGNTIVAGRPQLDVSDSALHPGASVIRVAVTLTNNGEAQWSPVFTTFGGTLDRVPLEESNEGDWKYSTPIAPQTSVTLSKVFLGGGGQFTLAVNTPQGIALFTGQV